MKSLFEQSGGTYSTFGDYLLPNLTVPDTHKYYIGVWGQRRLAFLKAHRSILYVNMLTSRKLYDYLCEIDAAAAELHENIIRQMVAAQGVTEQYKMENQMIWVGRMNNILAYADEIVYNELIYN